MKNLFFCPKGIWSMILPSKAEKIKQSLKQTKEKRKLQTPKVFQLKLQNLSKSDIKILNRLFLDAK
jgi:hypothetical protein